MPKCLNCRQKSIIRDKKSAGRNQSFSLRICFYKVVFDERKRGVNQGVSLV